MMDLDFEQLVLRVEQIETQIAEEKRERVKMQEDLQLVKRFLFGDDALGFTGMRKEFGAVKKTLETLVQDKRRQQWLLIGAVAGATLAGGASVATYLKVASLLVGVP